MDTDKKFYLQGTDAKKESFNRPELITLEWNIAYACNFRCPYCFFDGKWEEYGKRNVFPGVDAWMGIWQRISERYGRCALLITGGEPFVYPDFVSLVERLSQIHYPINISSNGSGDMERFATAVDPAKVSVTLSFHPGHNRLADILAKKKYLREKGFHSDFINFVCYPPFFGDMDRWVAEARAEGEVLKVIPFCGQYQGRSYPDGYTAEEKAKLGLGGTWEKNVKRKGRACAAGMKSALIFPDGKVARCGQIGEKHVLCNIFTDEFRLLDKPLACGVEYCPCLESDLPEGDI
jgi:hypothetical protein